MTTLNTLTQLQDALSILKQTTAHALGTSESLSRRSVKLSMLTSTGQSSSHSNHPSNNTTSSAILNQTASRIATTLTLLHDARDKLDTVTDCQPSIDRLYTGVQEMEESRRKNSDQNASATSDSPLYSSESKSLDTFYQSLSLTEQDVYAAADSLEIIRDAYHYFELKPQWKVSQPQLMALDRLYQLGVNAMCRVVHCHLFYCGSGVKPKKALLLSLGAGGLKNAPFHVLLSRNNPFTKETASDTRQRLTEALKKRDLMKEVGEYEESLPLDTRTVRELRAIFECLGGEDGCFLGTQHVHVKISEIVEQFQSYQMAVSKVSRTEKIGSGYFSKLSMKPFDFGYPHLNSYMEARKTVAFRSVHSFYRILRESRKKFTNPSEQLVSEEYVHDLEGSDLDSAARDAVRCLEFAMVVVAGEKSIYRCVVSPSYSQVTSKASNMYNQLLAASYSQVCASVVDRVLDILELFFIKDANIRHAAFSLGDDDSRSNQNDQSSAKGDSQLHDIPTVYFTASAAAAGLRILDAVRMLGPSLAKLCEMTSSSDKASTKDRGLEVQASLGSNVNKESSVSLASNLCVAIHRMTVKNAGKCLENLASSIKLNPINGSIYRPIDGRVATVTLDVVYAIQQIHPFANAYKTVTKRRALPWDPRTGEAAGEIDYFIKYLIMTLFSNLNAKAKQYAQDSGNDSEAKACIFLINNVTFLSQRLVEDENADYRIEDEWFKNQLDKTFSSSKLKYLKFWDKLNKHLGMIPEGEFSYTGSDRQLTLESGRILKARFNGFNDDFESTYTEHNKFTVTDPKVRSSLVEEVEGIFLANYRAFYDKYSSYNFSKKNKEEYLRYHPNKVEEMLENLFVSY